MMIPPTADDDDDYMPRVAGLVGEENTEYDRLVQTEKRHDFEGIKDMLQ